MSAVAIIFNQDYHLHADAWLQERKSEADEDDDDDDEDIPIGTKLECMLAN